MPSRTAVACVISAFLLAGAGGPADAQASRREPSSLEAVKTWSSKQWRAAQREWRQDKAKWASCRKQARQKKLSGRASWSFHYACMTK
jgi:hypothetical protein